VSHICNLIGLLAAVMTLDPN